MTQRRSQLKSRMSRSRLLRRGASSRRERGTLRGWELHPTLPNKGKGRVSRELFTGRAKDPKRRADKYSKIPSEVNQVQGRGRAGRRRCARIRHLHRHGGGVGRGQSTEEDDPKELSARNWRRHALTHLPHGKRCTHCLRGRRKAADHHRCPPEDPPPQGRSGLKKQRSMLLARPTAQDSFQRWWASSLSTARTR